MGIATTDCEKNGFDERAFRCSCCHYSRALYSTFIFTCTSQQKIHLHFISEFFPDLLFYTKIAFRFLEKETLSIVVLQSNGVTNIITVFKSYQHVSRTFLESNWAFCLMQMNVLLSCARGHESKKQYTWIMRTLTCKHKIWEKKVVHWSPELLPCVFSMTLKLAGHINWWQTSRLTSF